MAAGSKELATTRRRNLKHGEELGTRLIAAAQTVERHEITRYGAPVACAKRLGLSVATDIIQEMWSLKYIERLLSVLAEAGEGDPPTDAWTHTEADFWGEKRPKRPMPRPPIRMPGARVPARRRSCAFSGMRLWKTAPVWWSAPV